MLSCFGKYSLNTEQCRMKCFTIDECRMHEGVLADRDRIKMERDECRKDRQRDFINMHGDMNDRGVK